MVNVSPFAKALAAAVAAGAATLVAVMQDGGLDAGNVVTVVLAVLGALGVTYAVPNAQPTATAETD